MSLFITFEGCEGFGKSSQSKILFDRLRAEGRQAILTQEPGGTDLGVEVARLLKWNIQEAICPLAEVMLFNSSRAELVSRVIKPALSSGQVVVCDRYADSTLIYQGYGRGLSLPVIQAVNTIAIQGLMPDLTVLLNMPVEIGMERKAGQKADRIEKEGIDFHRRVRDGYLTLAAAEPQRFLVIDASLSKDAIAAQIWAKVSTMLTAAAPRPV
jgi:dTMP kinase